jgi:hypothetical protein
MVEDAQLLRLAPDERLVWENVQHGPACKPRTIQEFAPPPRGFEDIMKVTVGTAINAVHWASAWVDEVLSFQQGELEFAVAALLIWSTTPEANWLLPRLPIHRVKLELWPTALKSWATQVRLLGRITEEAGEQQLQAWRLRKIITLSGRNLQEADWSQELADRTGQCRAKLAFDTSRRISVAGYKRRREMRLKTAAQLCVRAVRDRPGDMWSWWDRRSRNTPSGSTSQHRQIKAGLKGLPEFDLQMRPTKKAAVERLGKEDLIQWLTRMPRCIARLSTKHEPGYKNRALYAQDDEGAHIAAFASEGLERNAAFSGMVLSQMPADIKLWIAAEKGTTYKVSNDYTNFNILHSPGDLAEVSLALCRAWLHEYQMTGKPRCVHKAICELWTAESYKRMFATGALNCRVTCGLYSGHRNTARDNTLLHRVYLDCVRDLVAGMYDEAVEPLFERMSGDDEVVHYNKWWQAVVHPMVSDGAGFTSKVEKGLLSRGSDEFLQFMRVPGGQPFYPVAHTILTFCSGNWYKTPVRDLRGTGPAVEDHAWDLVLGGVPGRVAQALAISVMDYLMQAKPLGVLRPKEWWLYRGWAELGGHPLWEHQGDTPPAIIPKLRLVANESVPKKAIQDLLRTEAKYWKLAPPEFVAEITQERLQDAYASVMRHELNKAYDQATGTWPDRAESKARSIPLVEAAPASMAVIRRLRMPLAERQPPSIFAVCMKYNIPPEVLERWPNEVISMAEPRARSAILHALRSPQAIKRKHWELPGMLRTAL